jgi:hypothetical protein
MSGHHAGNTYLMLVRPAASGCVVLRAMNWREVDEARQHPRDAVFVLG